MRAPDLNLAAAPPGSPKRQKIAVLGGGIGALAAVWSITSEPGWREKYAITVYQVGWRLGGKCASGRNLEVAARIEEHGLHIFMGFYENAFRLVRQCYAELGREPGAPLATWQDAFKPHSLVVLQEQIDDQWKPWTFEFPRNDAVPGDGGPPSTHGEFVRELLQHLPRLVQMILAFHHPDRDTDSPHLSLPALLRHFALDSVPRLVRLADPLLHLAIADVGHLFSGEHGASIDTVRDAREELWQLVRGSVERDDGIRRLWILVDLALTILYGVLKDDLLRRGFASIDDYDFAEWLARHGAGPTTIRSAPVRALYDIALAYADGDPRRPNFAAGTALTAIFHILFDYKGAVMWKMQAGMGDVLFAPLYEVLRRRGVRFAFFHRVKNLGLSGDGSSVATIEIGRQATVREADYHPLISVSGLSCWPDRPLTDQLVEGRELRQRRVDLESSWSDWPDVEEVTLRAGRDFDRVILGIPLGALPDVCAEIIRSRPAWQQMVEHVRTTATQACQIWLKPTLTEMGWPTSRFADGPIQGAYVQPLNTWADMTHLLARETWSPGEQPGSLAYFCGPLDEPWSGGRPPYSDHGFPERERARVKATARAFLESHASAMWPRARAPGSKALDFRDLADGRARAGADPLDGQYFRANVEPSERYVLSVKGSSQYRLRSDESGLANLYLTGDWTDTGLNVGCVEAAVMAGLRCSRALTRQPEDIMGSHIIGERNQPMTDEISSNLRAVRGLLNRAFNLRQPAEAAAIYLDASYRQHHPTHPMAVGGAAFVRLAHPYLDAYPELRLTIQLLVADGDLVVAQSLIQRHRHDPGRQVMDTFQLANGRIVEHWDVMQELPENVARAAAAA